MRLPRSHPACHVGTLADADTVRSHFGVTPTSVTLLTERAGVQTTLSGAAEVEDRPRDSCWVDRSRTRSTQLVATVRLPP
jgi:hypothetical protein